MIMDNLNNAPQFTNKEKGAEIRKKIASTFSSLFKRFGRKSVDVLDTTVGGVATGIDKGIEAGKYAYNTTVADMKEMGRNFVENKNAFVNDVKSDIEDVKNLINSGVKLTKDQYNLAKNKIEKGKMSVFAFITEKKIQWQNNLKRLEAERIQRKILNIQKVQNTLELKKQKLLEKLAILNQSMA